MIRTTLPLHQCELFKTLKEEEISKLVPLCSDFAAIEDSVLFTEGRNASHLYLVVNGEMALQKSVRVPHGTSSRRTTITICRSGEILGWSALVEPYRYTLSAVAWEASRLIRIDSKLLRKVLDANPEINCKTMTALTGVMARRLRQTTEALINERTLVYSGLYETAPVAMAGHEWS